MIRLESPPSGWISLAPGVRVDFAPIDRSMVRAARRAVRDFLAEHPDLGKEERQDAISDVFSAALIRRGICRWEGFGDPDGNAITPGQPVFIEQDGERIPYDPAILAGLKDNESPAIVITGLDLFMQRAVLVEAADDAWVLPWALQDAEKNVSAPSPDGISARATADMIIATSVVPAPKAKGKGAKRARTAKTSRERTPANPSGTS